MQGQNSIFKYKSNSDLIEAHRRQYYIIQYITVEFFIICALGLYIYISLKLWYLVALIGTATLLGLGNLYLLIRSKNTLFCGHVITLIIFLTVLIANYLVRGIGATFSVWFYIIPVLSVALVGRSGLYVYSILVFLIIVGCRIVSIPPYYSIPDTYLSVIEWVNHLFAFVIIATTLDSLMRESKRYEQLLYNRNYSLQLEKDKYHYLACFDELTDLPNRQYFKFNLEAIVASLSHQHCVTIFFMDLDNLKHINDHWGHDAGDYLLAETARRLRGCFREADFIARLGGDEFTAIVVHSRGEKISEVITKRIKHAFKQVFKFKNKDFYSSISIGLATYPDDTQSIEELMMLADRAMYLAKMQRDEINSMRPRKIKG
ncbi:GGDEF domain-containing protein [Legionella drozanskii]|uniref:GGDEF/EAL domain-containing sensory box protein n=1 Tax=Legionella drozanskii LLAP-1 TaxID=1212489 RepID=A0A0W0SRU8_9GAMM|nr:GGDEF domain-containing protein [Legionella drozanskii]KTC85929.1 GGDEF/EAL domain-containing sensory box protein [Legionella drozanskii LLAP-1]